MDPESAIFFAWIWHKISVFLQEENGKTIPEGIAEGSEEICRTCGKADENTLSMESFVELCEDPVAAVPEHFSNSYEILRICFINS